MEHTAWLEELLRKYYARMCAVSCEIVGSLETAEDIVQDVFVKLWDRRGQWDGIASPEDYIYMAVRNRSLNFLRNRSHTGVPLSGREAAALEETAEISAKLIEQDLNHLLMSAISRLPQKSARLMFLFLEGLGNNEIAAELGVSVNTVKTLKYASIRRLRQYFLGIDYDDLLPPDI